MSISIYGCNTALDIVITFILVMLPDSIEVLFQVALIMQGHDHCHVVVTCHPLRDHLESLDCSL